VYITFAQTPPPSSAFKKMELNQVGDHKSSELLAKTIASKLEAVAEAAAKTKAETSSAAANVDRRKKEARKEEGESAPAGTAAPTTIGDTSSVRSSGGWVERWRLRSFCSFSP
jgi:type IV secretory pathway TrbL component